MLKSPLGSMHCRIRVRGHRVNRCFVDGSQRNPNIYVLIQCGSVRKALGWTHFETLTLTKDIMA